MIPLSVNGAGWREAAYILLFQSVGVETHQAAALSVLWLGVLVVTSLPGGIIYIARGGRKKAPSPEEAGDARAIAAQLKASANEEISTI
jgi:hypothetical protein